MKISKSNERKCLPEKNTLAWAAGALCDQLFNLPGVNSRAELAIMCHSAQAGGILINEFITHTVHDEACNGFGAYLGFHVLANGFYGARTQEDFF